MGTRGKRSAASLGVVATLVDDRPDPWPGLTPPEADYWRNIVRSLPASWFRPSDLPLLAAYCQAGARHDQAVARLAVEDPVIVNLKTGGQSPNANFKIIASCIQQMAQLAGKLRLCPSSRYDAQKAQTKGKNEAPEQKPWEFTGGAKR